MLAICAALMAAPAMALETSPLVPGEQSGRQELVRMPAFGRNRSCKTLTASDKWLKQARVGGISIDLRVHTWMGEEVVFQECVRTMPGGSICLYITASRADTDLVLQATQHALDTLERVNVTEIVVGDSERNVCGRYQVAELKAVRAALGLEAGELLCVGGEHDPVTVVSEDGVRRRINP